MPTPRETILTALLARLSALPSTALRGEVLPERVPAEGLLILRDGEAVRTLRPRLDAAPDVLYAETGTRPRFLFVLVEKAEPFLVSVVELDELFYDVGAAKNHAAAAKWKEAVRTNEWPGYQGINRVLAPMWALDELEEEITE